MASALIFRTRFVARRFNPHWMTRSPQLPFVGNVGMLADELAIFFEIQHFDRRMPELRAKFDADLRGSSALSIHSSKDFA